MTTRQVFVRWLRNAPAIDVIEFADIPRGAHTYTGPVVTLTRAKDL